MRLARASIGVALLLGLLFALSRSGRDETPVGRDETPVGPPPSSDPPRVASVQAPEVAPTSTAATPSQPSAATTTAPRTTIAILQVAEGGEKVDLVRWVTKPIPCAVERTPGGAARWVLEDARTGVELAEGPCALPDLCTCGSDQDHAVGCVRTKHQAVVRLKLPRVAEAERLTILGPDGPIARFTLEGTS